MREALGCENGYEWEKDSTRCIWHSPPANKYRHENLRHHAIIFAIASRFVDSSSENAGGMWAPSQFLSGWLCGSSGPSAYCKQPFTEEVPPVHWWCQLVQAAVIVDR